MVNLRQNAFFVALILTDWYVSRKNVEQLVIWKSRKGAEWELLYGSSDSS